MTSTKDCKSLQQLQEFCQNQNAAVIHFYAQWSGPCKEIAPYLRETCRDNGVVLGRVNVDKARDAVIEYKVKAVPAFIVISKNGKGEGIVSGGNQANVKTIVSLAKKNLVSTESPP